MGQLYNGSGNTFKIGKESILGNAIAPTESLLHTGFSADINYDFIESASFTGTRASAGAFQVGKIGKISYPFEADSHNLGWVAKAALGSETVTTVSAGEYKHAFKMLNSSALPSFTIESSLGGVFHFTNSGAVCDTLSLDISPKSVITGTAEFISVDQVTKGSPTALTPATPVLFSYNDSATASSIKINGSNFGEVKSASINIANGLSTDDFRLGNAGKLSSLPAGKHKFSGSMVVVYNAESSIFESGLSTDALYDVALEFDSGEVLGTGTYKLQINIPTLQVTNLKVDGKDFIYYNIDFASVGDGAEIIVYNDKATAY